jgi:pentatricopeptide repeat protein
MTLPSTQDFTMSKYIQIVEDRVKELELIVSMTPIVKSFTAQNRLTEAKKILELLKENKIEPNCRTMAG